MILLSNGNLASCSRDRKVKIWEIWNNNLYLLKTFEGHTQSVYSLLELPNYILVSGSWGNHTLRFWDLINLKEYKVIEDPKLSYTCAMISINDLTIVVGSHKDVKFYDLNKGKCTKTMKAHSNVIRDMILSEDDKNHLFTCGHDDLIKMWQIGEKLTLLRIFDGHNHYVINILFL